MEIKNGLSFKNDIDAELLLAFTEIEMKHFQVDLYNLITKLKSEFEIQKSYIATSVAAQRFGDRNFKTELMIDMTPGKDMILHYVVFQEVEINEYLDHINECKNCQEGYKKLDI